MTFNLSILGATGSIGMQALDVARKLKICVSALAAHRNINLLEKQAREFGPLLVAVFDKEKAELLKENLADTNIKVLSGMDGICEAATFCKADTVLNAMVGVAGLIPTLEAIKAGKKIALANKETLVAGGDLVMAAAKQKNVDIVPVDSEHSAIFQCLEGCKDRSFVKKIILTASGGPFLGKNVQDLQAVTVEEALSHPNWKMGEKISVDSASLMNKGLELIEAVHLFDIAPDRIEVLVHRESFIHSMVEYKDNSVIAQMAKRDMRLPLQYAFTWPERTSHIVDELNFSEIKNFSFASPDEETFTLLRLCRKAINIGGNAPAFLSAANEEAVDFFLRKQVSFLGMMRLVEKVFEKCSFREINLVDDVLETDKQARELIKEAVRCGDIK